MRRVEEPIYAVGSRFFRSKASAARHEAKVELLSELEVEARMSFRSNGAFILHNTDMVKEKRNELFRERYGKGYDPTDRRSYTSPWSAAVTRRAKTILERFEKGEEN